MEKTNAPCDGCAGREYKRKIIAEYSGRFMDLCEGCIIRLKEKLK